VQRAEHRIRAADGRLLLVCTAGPPNGDPVIVLHGTPGVRQLYQPDIEEGARRGLRCIAYSRPDYGGSDPLPGRSVADCTLDICAIADHFGIGRFYVIGESGGGPHALACAASLPSRVRAVALIAGLAPTYAQGLDWIKGMGKGNIKEFEAARKGPHVLKKYLESEVRGLQEVKTVAQLREAQSEHLCEADVLVSQGDFGAFQLLAWKQIAKEGPSGLVQRRLGSIRSLGLRVGWDHCSGHRLARP
jgi:pimeloyl-ACP methyl ester carboxylesterase